MTKSPNLFSFATKELAQDAAIAYILDWANPEYRNSHPTLRKMGAAMLKALLKTIFNARSDSVIPRIETEQADMIQRLINDVDSIRSLEVKTQFERVDILVRINDESENGILLLIEDKVSTKEHSNQIERYLDVVTTKYPNRVIVPVFVKTGNTSIADLPEPEKCGRFLRCDLLKILNKFTDTGDTIVDNFRTYLESWENETQSFCDLPIKQWHENWSRFEGFYMKLEKWMKGLNNREEWEWIGWSYVANRAGGYLLFWCATNHISVDSINYNLYLQIESSNKTRLTARMSASSDSGPKVRSDVMYKVLDSLSNHAERCGDIEVKKAGRFSGGKSAAVAEITFKNSLDYIARKEDNKLDLNETTNQLVRAKELIESVSKNWT